jgi:hypothetical protein
MIGVCATAAVLAMTAAEDTLIGAGAGAGAGVSTTGAG